MLHLLQWRKAKLYQKHPFHARFRNAAFQNYLFTCCLLVNFYFIDIIILRFSFVFQTLLSVFVMNVFVLLSIKMDGWMDHHHFIYCGAQMFAEIKLACIIITAHLMLDRNYEFLSLLALSKVLQRAAFGGSAKLVVKMRNWLCKQKL